jgi:excisionase family DNA binding protein
MNVNKRQKEEMMEYRKHGAVSVMEACEFLGGIGVTKFYELVRRGDLPIVKIGRRSVVLLDDLEDYLVSAASKEND